MSLPKHVNPSNNRMASAPYNFVPLPDLVVKAVDNAAQLPDHNTYANADYPHSGYFEVTLTTKSPVYVRCPFTIDDFLRQERGEDAVLPFSRQVKNTPDFFYTRRQDQPVIPGSSLRGMLRGLLEVISYGKVQWVTEKKLFYRTVDTTSVGKDYTSRMAAGNGSKGNGYRQKAEVGFASKRGSEWKIEKCAVARAEMDDVATAFGVAGKRDLYTDLGPNGWPKWDYQHKPVWVQTEPTEEDHLHSKAYLHYLKVTSIRTSPSGTPGEREGVLVLSGPMQRQHMAFVFLRAVSAVLIDVPNDPNEEDSNKRILDRFQDDDQITRWQTSAFPDGEPGGAHRDRKGYLRDGEPVFFLREHGQLTFLGRAQMFRLPYTQSPLDLVPPELRSPEEIDYAEAMFGFVRTRRELDDMMERGLPEPQQGTKGRAYAGRVFVTDAALDAGQNDIWFPGDPVITPRILATPKATTFQHYLVQKADDPKTLKHYGSQTPKETVIRGHKRYWHQSLGDGLSLDQIRAAIGEQTVPPNSTQHSRFKPVKPEVRFTFRVHFENLSDPELGALCWTIHPLGEGAKSYCHHLGMGKPLGMGAVKLEATLHEINRETRYEALFDGDQWQTGVNRPGESLSDRATLEGRARAFERRILDKLEMRELAPGKPLEHLSDLKRIGMLLKTMEWPGFSPDPGDLYLTALQRPNTRYMRIQPNEYRERRVLPDPSAFGTLTGTATPTGTNASSSRQTPRTGTPMPHHKVANSERLAGAEVESVKRAISSLRGPGEVSLVDGIVNRIAALRETDGKSECAQALQEWLQAQKLWKKEKHASKPWHKKLEEMLT